MHPYILKIRRKLKKQGFEFKDVFVKLHGKNTLSILTRRDRPEDVPVVREIVEDFYAKEANPWLCVQFNNIWLSRSQLVLGECA